MPKSTTSKTEPTSAPPLPGRGRRVRPAAQPPAVEVPEAPAEALKPPAEEPQMQTDAPDEIVIPPANLDTPETDAAIASIIAQEADEVLAAQDAGLEAIRAEAETDAADEPKKQGHPIFWFCITLLAIIALIAAYVMTNPGLELPFSA